MARMIPILTADQLRGIRSRAEARFYEVCQTQLPNDVLVIYSAEWLYRDSKGRVKEGEADFTVLFPKSGVVVVEVKGGGVAHDASVGQWFSVDRSGQRHQIKDPFKQASNERHSVLDQLTGHPLWRQWRGRRLTIGHAVILPDINDSPSIYGPDRPREIIGTSKDLLDLCTWLDQVITFWRREGDDPLGEHGVRLVEEILCKSIEVRPALRGTIDDVERERLRLTTNQAKILRIIGGRRRAVVSGGAGTGKTLIAIEKARQLAKMGKTVLLLCYNRPLADALAVGLQDESNVLVLNFHQLCDRRIRQALQLTGRNLLDEAVEAYPGNSDKHRFEVQLPYALGLSNEIVEDKFDAIVIDEAQDFSDEYWFAIEELLLEQEGGDLFIFFDDNQALYARHGNLPIADEPYHLTSNCRNTAPIHEAGYAFYTGEPIDLPELLGPTVQRISIEGVEAQAVAVVRQVREWIRDDGLRPEDVVVLVASQSKSHWYLLLKQKVHGAGITWAVEHHGQSSRVLVETVARFKGLEAQAIVLWLGDDVIKSELWETVYVGITRAKSLLCIVGSPEPIKALRRK